MGHDTVQWQADHCPSYAGEIFAYLYKKIKVYNGKNKYQSKSKLYVYYCYSGYIHSQIFIHVLFNCFVIKYY